MKAVFHGDSVTTTRPGVTTADTYAYKVGTARGFSSIVNTGVMGDTSAMGLARFAGDVLAQAPDVLGLMFGINDVYRILSGAATKELAAAEYKANMLAMVQQAKAAGIRPTLLTPNLVRSTPYIDAFPPFLDALQQIADAESVPLVDVYGAFARACFCMPQQQFDALWLDPQHPSATGQTLIAQQVLRPALNACV